MDSDDLGFKVFDADNHYYEPFDAFTRHLAREHGPRVCQMAEIDGKKRHILAGKVDRTVANPTFDPIAKPGALWEWFRGNPKGGTVASYLKEREPIPAHYHSPESRVLVMDQQGVDQVWLFPTLGVMYEEQLKSDPEAVILLVDAFNKWLDEDWGYAYKDRIFAAPYVSLAVVDDAVRTLDWALERGARIVCVRPGAPVTLEGPRRPADPMFDPFWARVAESGITVVVHAGGAGDAFNGYVQNDVKTALDLSDASIWHALHSDRPIFDFMAALLYDRLFERFPNVRVASVENGSTFLPDLFSKVTTMKNKLPGRFADDPVDLFRQNVWVNPFWEDELNQLVELMGADRVIFGSDWPHVEGLVTPLDYLAETKNLSPDAQQKVLGDNARELNTLRPA